MHLLEGHILILNSIQSTLELRRSYIYKIQDFGQFELAGGNQLALEILQDDLETKNLASTSQISPPGRDSGS